MSGKLVILIVLLLFNDCKERLSDGVTPIEVLHNLLCQSDLMHIIRIETHHALNLEVARAKVIVEDDVVEPRVIRREALRFLCDRVGHIVRNDIFPDLSILAHLNGWDHFWIASSRHEDAVGIPDPERHEGSIDARKGS